MKLLQLLKRNILLRYRYDKEHYCISFGSLGSSRHLYFLFLILFEKTQFSKKICSLKMTSYMKFEGWRHFDLFKYRQTKQITIST